nr:hypothetical protein [Tanacetum cinerariifolium]
RRQRRTEQRQHTRSDAQTQPDDSTDRKADGQTLQARRGVLPQNVFAGALIGNDRHTFDCIRHLHRTGQQLVVGVFLQFEVALVAFGHVVGEAHADGAGVFGAFAEQTVFEGEVSDLAHGARQLLAGGEVQGFF